MKNNRRIYIFKDLYDNLKQRTLHVDEGLENDKLLSSLPFSISFNRDVLKRVNRLMEFYKTSSSEEINKLNSSSNIENYDNIYQGLKCYTYKNIFKLYFVENKRILGQDEYKFLYLTSYNEKIDFSSLRNDLDFAYEWKREYVQTTEQKNISHEKGYNIVLGAAGTGKTDVAIYTYINSINTDNVKNFSIYENSFITYSKKLKEHVSYTLDLFWNDIKNPICKNIYTTKDFFIEILSLNNIEIPNYYLQNGIYTKVLDKKIKEDDILNNNIVSIDTFINWINNSNNINKTILIKLNEIISKYGIDYPYLFYRGIYKGKIINKVSDEEVNSYFNELYNFDNKKSQILKELLDDYLEEDETLDKQIFSEWYKIISKRYNNSLKQILPLDEEEKLYNALLLYYDFVNPVREEKESLDYYPLFLREAKLIEGYRNKVRDSFEDEIKVIFEVCKSFDNYIKDNMLYDDNDLAYFIIQNLEKIQENGVFKNIIVDEFQDMTERQLHTITRLCYNEDNRGIIHLFGDFEQTINPTFIQLENVETIYMVNQINNYKKQILSSTYRYSDSICKSLERIRKKGTSLFGLEDKSNYVPLVSNKDYTSLTSGNLVYDFNIANDILKRISSSKNQENIMFVVSDNESKKELLEKYKVNPNKVYTISEAKGKEDDFVVVYKLCSSKSKEYESIFSLDLSYSRASRIFFNQLYVAITRCKTNYIFIEDDTLLGKNTLKSLIELIPVLHKENVDIFCDEILSDKINYYHRALESFKCLDFYSCKENLSFYFNEDYYNLKLCLNSIDNYINNKEDIDILAKLSIKYREINMSDLAKVIYTILDNNDMIILLNMQEENNMLNYTDIDIKNILINNKMFISDCDIKCLDNIGYFKRKEELLLNMISNMKVDVIKND